MSVKKLSSGEERHQRYMEYLDLQGNRDKIQKFLDKYSTRDPGGYIPRLESEIEIGERKFLRDRIADFKQIERECAKSNNKEKCNKLMEEWNKKYEIPITDFLFDYYARGIKNRKTRHNSKNRKTKKSKKHTKTRKSRK
jgi:hypothetical protein